MMENKKIAGSILFLGAVIYIMGTVIGDKYGEALIYNSSVLLLGLFMIIGAYYIQQTFKTGIFSILLIIAGLGTAALGLLEQDSTVYFAFATIGYIAFALSAVFSYKFEKTPFNYFSVILGISTLIAFALWVSGIELSAGVTITPIIADFPVLLWLLGFGAYILGTSTSEK